MIWPATPTGSRSDRLSALSGTGIDVAHHLGGEAAIILEAGGDVGHIVLGFYNRLAAIARFQFGERYRFLANALRQPEQNPAPLLRRSLRPWARIKGRARGLNRAVHIMFIGVWNFRDDFFGGRVIHRKPCAAVSFHALAINVHSVTIHNKALAQEIVARSLLRPE